MGLRSRGCTTSKADRRREDTTKGRGGAAAGAKAYLRVCWRRWRAVAVSTACFRGVVRAKRSRKGAWGKTATKRKADGPGHGHGEKPPGYFTTDWYEAPLDRKQWEEEVLFG
jgi:hypothetical protein